MADGLVEEDAAEPVAHHHGQAPGGGVHRVEEGEGSLGGLARNGLRVVLDELPAGVAAAVVAACLDAAVPARDDLDAEADPGAVVGRGQAV